MKEKIIIATGNENKLKEFKKLFSEYEVLCLKDIDFNGDIEENGTTTLENSLIKARVVSDFLKAKNIFVPVLADDSGLFVNALNGEPGIYSARYAGVHGNNQANRNKLLSKMEGVEDRTAYFQCSLVKLYPDGRYVAGEGRTYGKILKKEDGNTAFAFDCIFFSDDLQKSFGSATPEEKNSVSHRSRAILDLIEKDKNI